MEAIAQQLTSTGFNEGSAQLKDLPEEEFKACFSRFEGDELNYWNESKQLKAGKVRHITKIYGDQTVTMEFENGEKWDFPFEVIEKNI